MRKLFDVIIPYYSKRASENERVLTDWDCILIGLISIIPLINLIFLTVWYYNKRYNRNIAVMASVFIVSLIIWSPIIWGLMYIAISLALKV